MIDKIVIGLATMFSKVEFDVDIEVLGDKSEIYKILVGDLDFYMNNKPFKRVVEQYRVKYPSTKFFCYYQNV